LYGYETWLLTLREVHRLKIKGGDRLGDRGVDGRMILKCISKKLNGKIQTGFIWLRTGYSVGLL
jgi:hypothetical protein